MTFITGHCRPDGDGLDWADLARARQTLAIYMGTMKAADISQRLIAHGRVADTPVAVISRGTRADQQVQIGTLDQLEHLAQRARAAGAAGDWRSGGTAPSNRLVRASIADGRGRAPGRREFGIGKAFKDLLWTKTTHSFAAIGGGEYPYHP